MTNLSDFLKVKQVRCVKAYGDCLTVGKEYSVLNIRMEVEVRDDEGGRYYWESDHFEPVLDSAENPLQGVELTPEFEAVEPKFKVGDKVYYRAYADICVVSDVSDLGEVQIKGWREDYYNSRYFCHATQENYEMLCNLYPHIEFEQPTKPLTGSDLCRAMLDKGWKYVPCYVSNTSDKNAVELDDCGVIYTVNHNGNFQDGYGETWCHVVPFDPRTGEPLTEAVLGE